MGGTLDTYMDHLNEDFSFVNKVFKANVLKKIADKMIVLAKKKYVLQVLDNEGVIYDEPKIKVKGIETVRTDTPSFCRKTIKSTIKEIFNTTDKVKIEECMAVCS